MKITRNLSLCAALFCLCGCSSLKQMGSQVLQSTITELRYSVSQAIAGEEPAPSDPAPRDPAASSEAEDVDTVAIDEQQDPATDPIAVNSAAGR